MDTNNQNIYTSQQNGDTDPNNIIGEVSYNNDQDNMLPQYNFNNIDPNQSLEATHQQQRQQQRAYLQQVYQQQQQLSSSSSISPDMPSSSLPAQQQYAMPPQGQITRDMLQALEVFSAEDDNNTTITTNNPDDNMIDNDTQQQNNNVTSTIHDRDLYLHTDPIQHIGKQYGIQNNISIQRNLISSSTAGTSSSRNDTAPYQSIDETISSIQALSSSSSSSSLPTATATVIASSTTASSPSSSSNDPNSDNAAATTTTNTNNNNTVTYGSLPPEEQSHSFSLYNNATEVFQNKTIYNIQAEQEMIIRGLLKREPGEISFNPLQRKILLTRLLPAYSPAFPELSNVVYKVVWNDGSSDSMQALINAKNVFSTQLPKMPKEYIVRLVLDRHHKTMVIQPPGSNRVIGGICYRPFPTQRFAEIVFCAISQAEQGKGYGRVIMANLKEHVKTEGIDYFLTYADNHAIKYFAKQGFTRSLTMSNDRWKGWIKDYDGATLMECGINKEVNYIRLFEFLQQQRSALFARIRQASYSHRQGQMNKATTQYPIQIEDIPGMNAYKHRIPVYPKRHIEGRDFIILTANLAAILRGLVAFRDSWPFRRPVDKSIVSDYYQVIHNPIDLQTMEYHLNQGYYKTQGMFEADMLLLVNNCKIYNGVNTQYYRLADHTWVEYVRLRYVYFSLTNLKGISTLIDHAAADPSTYNHLRVRI